MRTIATFVVFSLLLGARAWGDVTGTWDLEMFWQNDVRSTGVCTLKEDTQTLTGGCGGTDKFAIVGDVKERQVTFEFEAEQAGTKAKMTFVGQLDEEGKTIKGTCRIEGGQDGRFTMTKRQAG